MMATIDFQAVKTAFDLEQTITSYIGSPDRSGLWLCPFHAEKTPSFGVYAPDNSGSKDRFKCFGCGAEGDVIDFIRLYERLANNGQAARKLAGNGYVLDLGLSPAEIKARKAELEAERKRLQEEKRQAKLKAETEALNRVNSLAGKVDWYHSQVGPAIPYWQSQGIGDYEIERYRLGYAPTCPILYPEEERQASYVIPYYDSGKLVSIRHRLSRPNGHGKYRPEFAGLPPQLFNVDSLKGEDDFSVLGKGEVVVVEGEVKAIILGAKLGPTVGLPGATNWREEWSEYFKGYHTAYWIPDPGIKMEIRDRVIGFVANGLREAGLKVIVCSCPAKPDDLFVKYGITTTRFMGYLERGRIYNG